MKYVTIASTVLIALFVSCKKEQEVPVLRKAVVVEKNLSKECYLGIINKDTFSMSLEIKGNEISSGELNYNFFEKDKNEGTLAGELKGDTLFADYTFTSEGVSSVREVAFLKKGNTYTEGFGDIVENNGKVVFKNAKQLKFGKLVLSKVDCK
ncbi:MAG: hypothetical protein V4572_10930 [Bacteroidota bacterium]